MADWRIAALFCCLVFVAGCSGATEETTVPESPSASPPTAGGQTATVATSTTTVTDTTRTVLSPASLPGSDGPEPTDTTLAVVTTATTLRAATTPSVSMTTITATASTPAAITTTDSTRGRTATVTRVVDGDTVEVEFADDTTDTIRLLGIDTPETTLGDVSPDEYEGIPSTEAARDHLFEWGGQATQFVDARLAGEQVRVVMDPKSDQRGSYGRLLAYIVHNGTNINRLLLEQGFARMYDSEFARRDEFASVEQQARSNNVGLWAFDGRVATATPTATVRSVDGNGGSVVTPTPSGGSSDPYDCSDFEKREQVEAVFDPENDVSDLDGNGDGKACESI